MPDVPRLTRLHIEGFRPFRDFTAELGPLEVIVGANAGGKSALFDFLRFLRDASMSEIPPGIMPDGIGQSVFHVPGPERIAWEASFGWADGSSSSYSGQLTGPLGRERVASERLVSGDASGNSEVILDSDGRRASICDQPIGRASYDVRVANELVLSRHGTLSVHMEGLRMWLERWRFYSSFCIARDRIRSAAYTEQSPELREDGGNLSAVLHYLYTEHRDSFRDLQSHIGQVVPGFEALSVKARGGPGQIMAFWRERGVSEELSLADLSDGTLRLLCWLALCVHPRPPTLVCIDEPDQGLHPRAYPLLAELFRLLADRTQVILTTHSSAFLAEFALGEIAVMRKEDGAAVFRKPSSSPVLRALLDDFGQGEIERLHRTDEMEFFA